MSTLRTCIVFIILSAIYIFTSVALSNLLSYNQANGSIITINNKTLGSKLIGQNFTSNKHFHNRVSLNNYKNNISANSNTSYYSPEFKDLIKTNFNELNLDDSKHKYLNLITESASGLDPDITIDSALHQSKRISLNTGLSEKDINKIIFETAKPRILGIIGERIVNVLKLNIKLDDIYAKSH